MCETGGCFFLGWHVYLFWGGPPFRYPHQDKKGTNLLLFQTGIHLHTHQDLKLKRCRVMGENWDTDAHAHVTYQAPITGLHNPTLLPFLQNSTDYLKLAQSCKFGVTCCSIGLTHPAACTLRVCLWLLDISTDPPFNPICSKKVQIDWAWAQDSDDIFEIP